MTMYRLMIGLLERIMIDDSGDWLKSARYILQLRRLPQMPELRCDKCNKLIYTHDERVRDFLDRQYEETICEKCDAEIQIRLSVEQQAMINNATPQEILKKWLKNYE